MTNDILSQVRAMKDDGRLSEIAALYDNVTFTESQLLARFALMVLEQKLPCDVKLMPGLLLHKNVPVSTLLLAINNREEYERMEAEKTPELREAEKEKRDGMMISLGFPPVPAPDDVTLIGYAENGIGFIYPVDKKDQINNPVAVYKSGAPDDVEARAERCLLNLVKDCVAIFDGPEVYNDAREIIIAAMRGEI